MLIGGWYRETLQKKNSLFQGLSANSFLQICGHLKLIPVKLQNIVCDIPRGHLQTALAGLSRQQQYK